MNKPKKISLITLVLITFIPTPIIYVTKNCDYLFYFSIPLFIFIGLLLYHPMEKIAYGQSIKEDINFLEVIAGEVPEEINWGYLLYKLSYILAPAAFTILILLYNFINPQLMVTVGVSIVGLSATLSVVSFNYANSVTNWKNKRMIYFSAKRYYMATINGVITFILICIVRFIMLKEGYIPEVSVFNSLTTFIEYYLNLIVYETSFIFYLSFLMGCIKYLIEALILSFKSTVEFHSISASKK